MAKKENEYKRLKGAAALSGFSVVGRRSQLYMGKDHLLRLNSSGWTENYRRFYFGDIQAMAFTITNARLIWNIVLMIPCVLFLLWFLNVDDMAGRIVLGILAGFFGVALLINMLRGPSCRVRIQTRVGTETLPSLQRLSQARRMLETIRPHIEAAQGTFNPPATPAAPEAPAAAEPPASGEAAAQSFDY